MNSVAEARETSRRDAFVKWQCRVRQFAIRQRRGRPDEAVMPEVVPDGEVGPAGRIVTVLNRVPERSVLPELEHIAARTHDPAERLEGAIRFLGAGYYQTHREFSDTLTATFPPGDAVAARILDAGGCALLFDAYSTRFDLSCRVRRLARNDPLSLSTLAHNRLFNPAPRPDVQVLGFEPDWRESRSGPKAA